VRTKLAEALWKQQESQLNSATALGRVGEPEDVGLAIAFLVPDAASWSTGETFAIDRGQRLDQSTGSKHAVWPSRSRKRVLIPHPGLSVASKRTWPAKTHTDSTKAQT
jgi:hypothetical protein